MMAEFQNHRLDTKLKRTHNHSISLNQANKYFRGYGSYSNVFGSLLLLGSLAILCILSFTGFIVTWYTEYYNNTLLSKIVLKNNSKSLNSWMNPNSMYDTLLKIHIFNYTNIERYLSGKDDKIKLVDIGPFTYKEHTQKVNVSFNKNFTVTYKDHRTYKFLRNKSILDHVEKFMVPNVPLISASAKIETLYGLKKFAAIRIINYLNEPFFKLISAFEFLWGYKDKIITLDIGTGNTHFGLLMNRNGTSSDSLQINTGEDDMMKYSKINQFNGQQLMTYWSDEQCNRIDGSDPTMFPPHLLKNRDKLFVFLQVLCRKIPLQFFEEVALYKNIRAVRYQTTHNVFAHPKDNPDNQCYCQNTRKCLPSGVINATNCYNGAPIYPSFPHFLDGDKQLYEIFDGINPDASKHQTFADLHPRFAFPISGASRIQINIAVEKGMLIKGKLDRLRDDIFLPLIWIEITSGDFSDDIIAILYKSTVGLDTIQNGLMYGTLLTSITSICLITLLSFLLLKTN